MLRPLIARVRRARDDDGEGEEGEEEVEKDGKATTEEGASDAKERERGCEAAACDVALGVLALE